MIRCDDPFVGFFAENDSSLQTKHYGTDVLEAFVDTVWAYYKHHKRCFAWRETWDPYKVVVSEIMLQQTQTQRVAEKYEQFIKRFPTFCALASAKQQDVLVEWVGLGYNRRALALQWIAQTIVRDYSGVLPDDPKILETFKGLGPATAASITAFAFNKPTVFIETNIRSVFLHVFFHEQFDISDKQLLPLVAQTVDQNNAREWYYALMDCGVLLKKLYPNPSHKSKHHTRQSTFVGSNRQVRGAIVRYITQHGAVTREVVAQFFPAKKAHLSTIIEGLIKDGFIVEEGELLKSQ